MAQVPNSEGVASVAPETRVPDDYQHIQANPDQFGGLIARGEQEFGAGATKASQFFGEVAANDGYNQLQDFGDKLYHGDPNKMVTGPDGQQMPDPGFKGLTGQAALRARPDIEKQLDDKEKSIRQGLQTPAQQLQFDQYSRRYRAVLSSQIGEHANQQATVWYGQVKDQHMLLGTQHIINNADNYHLAQNGIAEVTNAYVQQAQLGGAQPGDAAYQDAVTNGTRVGTATWINAIGANDPITARRMVEKNKDVLGPVYDTLAREYDSRSKVIRGAQIVREESEKLAPNNFQNTLRMRESSEKPTQINQFGYAGSYQFGAPRLADLGVYHPAPNENMANWSKTSGSAPDKWQGTFDIPNFPEVKTIGDFLRSSPAQEQVYQMHQHRMDLEINQNGLDKYIGTSVGGVPITRDGLYGMIHLGGVGGAKTTLNSGGTIVPRDANGTSLLDYAKMGAITSQQQAAPDKASLLKAVMERTQGDPELQISALTSLNHQYTAQQAAYIDQERAQRIQDHQKKEAFNQGIDEILKDSVSAKPKITAQDVANNPMFEGRDKEYALQLLNRPNVADLPTPISARNTRALYDRMNLPDGDPNKITDLRSINEAYAHGSKNPQEGINRTDHEWLTKMFKEGRTEDGNSLQRQQSDMFKAVEPMIDKSVLGLTLDESGKMGMYLFMRDAQRKVDDYRNAKPPQDPSPLFTPGSPEFLGSPDNVARYRRPLQVQLQEQAASAALPKLPSPQPASAPAPAQKATTPGPPIRLQGENIGAYMVRAGMHPGAPAQAQEPAAPVSR